MNKFTKNLLEALIGIIMIILIIASIYYFIATSLESSFCREDWTTTEYVVESGDTLWDIAEIYCPESVDCRDWIDAVKSENGIDSTLYAGQVITIFEYNK